MKSNPAAPGKPAWEDQALAHVDLSEPRNLVRFCTFVTAWAIACSVVIAACWGRLDYLLASLAIAGVISLNFWAMTLLAMTFILIPEIVLRLLRLVARRTSRGPNVRGGVADEWFWPGRTDIRPGRGAGVGTS